MSMLYRILIVMAIHRLGTASSSPQQQQQQHYYSLFRSSCQGNAPQLKISLIHFSHRRHSLIISNRNSSSTLFSCEQQQTTSHSSSGFAILYSSANLHLLNIANSPRIPSNNAALFHVNQSLSSSTLMSSNANNPLVDSDSNTTTTLIHTLLSTAATTILSNVSLHHPTEQGKRRTWNLTLLIGCLSGSLVLIIILVYALMKYRNRDEGSYKIDESHNFLSNSPLPKHESNSHGGKQTSSTHHRQKLLPNQEPNGVDAREWYV